MKIYKYIEMHGEKYFCENIKEYIKTESIKICTLCKKCIWQNMLDFWCFNLYLETYSFHHLLNWFVIFNKNFLVPLDHFFKENTILLICQFCFNIRLYNYLQVQERCSTLLVALEILRNSAPMLPKNILLRTLHQ